MYLTVWEKKELKKVSTDCQKQEDAWAVKYKNL